MMTKSTIMTVFAGFAFGLTACASEPVPTEPSPVADAPAAPATSTASSMFIDWTNSPIDNRWYVSNHNMPDAHIQSDYRRANVSAVPSGLNLKMTRKTPVQREWDWDGGEIQFNQKRGFGEYHVIMKAAQGSGLVTSFFTHTGPHYGTPHDEIDVSFVGGSPYEVQLNIFESGNSMAAIKYPLDFDTSKQYALYSFTWEPDRITWYVNGEFAFEITEDIHPIPQRPGLFIANLAAARNADWAGAPDFEEGSAAVFRCMSYRELDDNVSRTCADEYITAE